MSTSAKRVPMIATARQCYEGRWLHSGEPFEVASEEDAADLVAMRFAERVSRPASAALNPSTAGQEQTTAAAGTEDAGSTGKDDKTEQQKQQELLDEYRSNSSNKYNRRDMRNRK